MVITIWAFSVCASVWILAWYLGTQTAILGAVVMTLACVGVAIIYLIIERHL